MHGRVTFGNYAGREQLERLKAIDEAIRYNQGFLKGNFLFICQFPLNMTIPYSAAQCRRWGSIMRDSQLEKMSLKELVSLDAKIKAAIGEKRVSERHDLKAKMEELARASGFSVGELFGHKSKGGKGVPKYRNPKDPSQTWTGRGRRPLWMAKAGGDIERFLIS
jgi:DNA-binding protein H-NS